MSYIGLPPRYTDLSNRNLSEAELLAYQDRLQNIYTNGGPGVFAESINLGPIHIDNGLAAWANDVLGSWGRRMLGWGPGTNPGTVAMTNAGGASFVPGGGGAAVTSGAPLTASGGTAFTPGNTSAVLAQGAGYGGWSMGVNPMGGGFGIQSTEVLNIAAPKLNDMERQLQDLRNILGGGSDLTQSQMLKYQDLMQRMNQIFMWCQGCMQSEHEKNKNWAQTLGRI